VKTTVLKPFTAPTDPTQRLNPFLQDPMNMGTYLGKNLGVMFGNFDKEECGYIILVNLITGERIRVDVETQCVKCGKVGYEQIPSMAHGGTVCPDCYALKD
jgi:hypothetical protein